MRYLDTENEIWLPIEEVNGKYEVSNKGNVRNSTSGKILKANLDLMGYPIVIISDLHYTRFTRTIHRLVAKYFCDGYAEGLVVNHKDGNKTNNHYTNLEWVTQSENVKHAFSIGLAKSNAWRLSKRVLCVETDVSYTSTKDASKSTGIHQGNISAVCRGSRKTAGGYTWKFIDAEEEK